MPAEFTNGLPDFENRMRSRVPLALFAAANVLRNAVVSRLQNGYTSGAFVTGQNIQHVSISEVADSGSAQSISIGTDLLYALVWEIGHENLFTRKYERVEHWRHAWEESQGEIRDTYAGVMRSAA